MRRNGREQAKEGTAEYGKSNLIHTGQERN